MIQLCILASTDFEHSTDDKCIFLNKNYILVKILLNFVPDGPIGKM